jgi:hypothetical protein
MKAAKVDANQSEIVECFRKLGFSVQTLHTVGQVVVICTTEQAIQFANNV